MSTENDTFKVHKFKHGTVIVTNKYSVASGRMMPKISVQIIDAYRYQREWTLAFCREPGGKRCYWESHVYKHPGQRNIVELSPDVAKRLWDKFLDLVENYPALLFNDENERRARHEGFVHFSDTLLCGATPSCTLL